MRISTSEFLLGSLPDLLAQQSNVNELNREIATGQTMLDATSDPTGAALALQIGGEIAQLNYDSSNAQGGTISIQNAVAALQQVSTLISQLRQTAVQGADATTSASQRQSLVAVVQSGLQQLLQLANAQGPDGQYLFAGSHSTTAPFATRPDGQVAFIGDGATNAVEIAPGISVPVGASGQAVFMNVPAGQNGVAITAAAGNTGDGIAVTQGVTSVSQLSAERLAGTEYQIAFGAGAGAGSLAYTITSGAGAPGSSGFGATSGVVASGSYAAGQELQFAGLDVTIDGTPSAGDSFVVDPGASSSLFQTVQGLIAALQSPAQGAAGGSAAQQQIENAIANLDGAQTSVLSAQASLGSGLAEIQAVQGHDQTQATNAEAQLSNLQSANLPQVMANYSASVTALQASELAFSRIQNLNLFSVIGP